MVIILRIWVGSDHGGFELKGKIVEQIIEQGHEVVDVGCSGTDIVRYPYYAAEVVCAVAEGKAERGILVCSTGIGMSIYANKFPKIRAALCLTTTMAEMTRLHNDSNILCLGGKITGEWDALRILDIWLKTGYEGGRHDISLDLIAETECINMTGDLWKHQGERK